MGLDDGIQQCQRFCSKSSKNCEEFQNVADVRNANHVIYRHICRTQNINMDTEVLETARNATKDVNILLNSIDVEILCKEIGSELEQNTVGCPQCGQLIENAQKILPRVSTADKKIAIEICDHCRTKIQLRKSCNKYGDVVKKFKTNKGDNIIEESKQRVKIWLSKVKHLLKDALNEVERSKIIRSRTYSDPYIDRISKFSYKRTSPEPEINQIFYPTIHGSHLARKCSLENIPVLKFKEQSEVPDICFKKRKRSLIFDPNVTHSEYDRRVKTSFVEKLTSGVRKYHSEGALQITMSYERMPRDYFSYCFPKSDEVKGSDDMKNHISSAELIKKTRDILRYKANEDKVKQENVENFVLEDTIFAYEQSKRLVGEINKVAEKSEFKLLTENFAQKTLTSEEKEEQMLMMKNNKIAKDGKNLLNSNSSLEKHKFTKGKKYILVDEDLKHSNHKEKNKNERGKQKTEQITEKQYFRAENNKLSEKAKKGVIQGEKQKHSLRETTKPVKGEAKKTAEREIMKSAESETKKLNEKKANKYIEEATNVTEKAAFDGKDNKKHVQEDKNTFKEGKINGTFVNVTKKQYGEKIQRIERNKSQYKKQSMDHTNSTQNVKKNIIEKENKTELTDQDHLSGKKTSKPTKINEVKTIMNGKPGVTKNNDITGHDKVYFEKPNENKMQDMDDHTSSKLTDKKQQEQKHEPKKEEETTVSTYNEQEPINPNDNIVEEQKNYADKNKKLIKETNEQNLATINTRSITENGQDLATINTRTLLDKETKNYAEIKSKNSKENPDHNSEQTQSTITKNKIQQLSTNKELRIDQIKIKSLSLNNIIPIKLKQENMNETRLKIPRSLSQIAALQLNENNIYKNRSWACDMCIDSDFELDEESAVYKKNNTYEMANIIIGQKLFKYKPPITKKKAEYKGIPALLNIEFKEDMLFGKNDILDLTIPEEGVRKPPLHTIGTQSVEQEIPKGIVRYALSDRTFIDKGWTMLPTEKVVRKMNVYRMRPVHPEFDWFEHNKKKRLMHYDTGEKLAEFDDNGRGRWYYRNGRLALDYYDAEEVNTQQRFVVYSSGEPDERGRSHPITILATFDYLGNGIVFDHSGKLRLKYNQTEGVVLDREIGPVSHWKWHSLNDPPVLQQVMIDTQIAHKVPEILKLGGPSDRKARPDNEEMLAIEFDNFINEKSKKLTQTFKPFQIKMKALKINEHFSLRVLDQTTIYLIFRDGSTNIKLNIGMLLDHKEIIDTDTAEVGDVSNNLERFPARTDSLAGMQRSVANAQHFEHCRMERERRLRPPVLCRSVDRLTAPISRPLRRPLRTVPSGSATAAGECYCRLNRKPSLNLYCDTRFV